MITLTSNEQAKELIKNGVLAVDDDIEIAFDGFSIEADIKCHNIYSKEHPRNITCRNINCRNITCGDINCGDITCWDITCGDITCWDINCLNITCGDINYYAVCFAYNNIKCKSIKGRRENCKHFCLDGEITFKDKKEDDEVDVTVEGQTKRISRKSAIALGLLNK